MASGLFTLKNQLVALIQNAWSGTSPSNAPKYLEYLVVAGGGGGAGNANGASGGGGAGGLLQGLLPIVLGQSYTITVGGGGAGGLQATDSTAAGTSGANTVFGNVTAVGGGGGSASRTGAGPKSGGSGGGSSQNQGTPISNGNGTSGQGNAGGGLGSQYSGSGGGGAGTAGLISTSGGSSTNNIAGNGGAGIASSISGTNTNYAGGGGGGGMGFSGAAGTAGIGGVGGGGTGGYSTGSANVAPFAGSSNSGGGGGGANNYQAFGTTYNGGAGGSGIVIVRYSGNVQFFSGGTLSYDSVNNYTVHTFYASGTLAPLTTPVTYGTTSSLTKSLRFRSSNTSYLNRTFGSGNQRNWTFSTWFKIGTIGTNKVLLSCGSGATDSLFYINSNDQLVFNLDNVTVRQTTMIFRDTSAWYHIVVALDTTNATAQNRVRIYINNVEITSWLYNVTITQNATPSFNSAITHNIGKYISNSGLNFDGEMTEVYWVDGQTLTPQSFGQYDSTSGVWSPMSFVGTYGTNGFYLPFTNTTSTTTLGYDSSGNGNNWTTNNISLTAGSTYDSMNDVPTLTSATASNYAVLNANNLGTNAVLSNGNLTANTSSGAYKTYTSTIANPTGSFYCEFTAGANTNGDNMRVGICLPSEAINSVGLGTTATSYCYSSSAYKINNNSTVSYGATYTSGDVIGVAFDGSTLTFYKNGTSQGSAYTGLSGTFMFAISLYGTAVANVNFGQQPFTYTPPSGYVALNTYNLPTPSIVRGNQYMDASLYTGNGGSNVIMNAGSFQPDFVWMKTRSTAGSHTLQDSVRGTSSQLVSNSANAQESNTDCLTAFNTNGFSLGANITGTLVNCNVNGYTYDAWQWKGGGTAVSNTSGSITSQVSANTTAGFSVVTYTGTGANATVGHGLGVAPLMIIIKNRTTAGTDWNVYHASLGNANVIFLDLTNASTASSTNWNNTSPTSSVFTVGTVGGVNGSGANLVAYCFAQILGFSAFGSYTGNGSTAGPFIYTGFRPKFILIKDSSNAGNWNIYDSSVNTYNTASKYLLPNLALAEQTFTSLNILSNGFQQVNTDNDLNASGRTYIYMAFASNPFKYSTAY